MFPVRIPYDKPVHKSDADLSVPVNRCVLRGAGLLRGQRSAYPSRKLLNYDINVKTNEKRRRFGLETNRDWCFSTTSLLW